MRALSEGRRTASWSRICPHRLCLIAESSPWSACISSHVCAHVCARCSTIHAESSAQMQRPSVYLSPPCKTYIHIRKHTHTHTDSIQRQAIPFWHHLMSFSAQQTVMLVCAQATAAVLVLLRTSCTSISYHACTEFRLQTCSHVPQHAWCSKSPVRFVPRGLDPMQLVVFLLKEVCEFQIHQARGKCECACLFLTKRGMRISNTSSKREVRVPIDRNQVRVPIDGNQVRVPIGRKSSASAYWPKFSRILIAYARVRSCASNVHAYTGSPMGIKTFWWHIHTHTQTHTHMDMRPARTNVFARRCACVFSCL